MKRLLPLLAILVFTVWFIGATGAGASNFDRLVLGSGNYGTDPNTTADITGQNDEYISNYVNGQWDFGAANLTTTGTITSGTINSQTISSAANLTGTLTVGGLLTAHQNGLKLALHAVAAGDSVFGHVILRSTDTVLVMWNGTAWATVADLAP